MAAVLCACHDVVCACRPCYRPIPHAAVRLGAQGPSTFPHSLPEACVTDFAGCVQRFGEYDTLVPFSRMFEDMLVPATVREGKHIMALRAKRGVDHTNVEVEEVSYRCWLCCRLCVADDVPRTQKQSRSQAVARLLATNKGRVFQVFNHYLDSNVSCGQGVPLHICHHTVCAIRPLPQGACSTRASCNS